MSGSTLPHISVEFSVAWSLAGAGLLVFLRDFSALFTLAEHKGKTGCEKRQPENSITLEVTIRHIALMLLEGCNLVCFSTEVPMIPQRRKQQTSGEKCICLCVYV